MFFQRLSRYKDKDGLLPSNEYMVLACRGVHHTYSTCIHSDTPGKFMHTIARIHTVTNIIYCM